MASSAPSFHGDEASFLQPSSGGFPVTIPATSRSMHDRLNCSSTPLAAAGRSSGSSGGSFTGLELPRAHRWSVLHPATTTQRRLWTKWPVGAWWEGSLLGLMLRGRCPFGTIRLSSPPMLFPGRIAGGCMAPLQRAKARRLLARPTTMPEEQRRSRSLSPPQPSPAALPASSWCLSLSLAPPCPPSASASLGLPPLGMSLLSPLHSHSELRKGESEGEMRSGSRLFRWKPYEGPSCCCAAEGPSCCCAASLSAAARTIGRRRISSSVGRCDGSLLSISLTSCWQSYE
mmetsp:Transcript_32283/g.64391  ORF Transcript_32283/g.64391 Transcript_32283/m.64391 type:complete len:287 (-) Transcript_32283:811-1671(-)